MGIIIGFFFIVILLISLTWISKLIIGTRKKGVMSICKGIIGLMLVIGSSYVVYTIIWIFVNAPESDFG